MFFSRADDPNYREVQTSVLHGKSLPRPGLVNPGLGRGGGRVQPVLHHALGGTVHPGLCYETPQTFPWSQASLPFLRQH